MRGRSLVCEIAAARQLCSMAERWQNEWCSWVLWVAFAMKPHRPAAHRCFCTTGFHLSVHAAACSSDACSQVVAQRAVGSCRIPCMLFGLHVLAMHASHGTEHSRCWFVASCIVYVPCSLVATAPLAQVLHEAVCEGCNKRFVNVGRTACCLHCVRNVVVMLSAFASLEGVMYNAAVMLRVCASGVAQ